MSACAGSYSVRRLTNTRAHCRESSDPVAGLDNPLLREGECAVLVASEASGEAVIYQGGSMSETPAPPSGGVIHTSEDEQILHKMGYAQELFRAMGGFQNFAISFTIIS